MIQETLSDPVALSAIALVGFLVAIRLYAGGGLLSIQYLTFWAKARTVFMPVVDQLSKRLVGITAENTAVESEYVATVQTDPQTFAEALQRATDRKLEVSVLSGLKTDWEGHTEAGSIVGYTGTPLFPNAPKFLRADQIHIFVFETDDGLRVCGHYEANSFRPDKWRDHLFMGETFDRAKGVEIISEWIEASELELAV